jgi:hypothetical protein
MVCATMKVLIQISYQTYSTEVILLMQYIETTDYPLQSITLLFLNRSDVQISARRPAIVTKVLG